MRVANQTLFTAEWFQAARRRLGKSLQGGILVLSAHNSMQQSADIAYRFKQESNFLYLTGINSPGWQVIYDGTRDHTWLVRPDVGKTSQLFDGSLADDEALRVSGADEIIAEAEFELVLRKIARQHQAVYALEVERVANYDFVLNPSTKCLHDRLKRIFTDVIDVRNYLAELRSIKTPEEIAAIEKALSITAKAFLEARSKAAKCTSEYELEAIFSAIFRQNNTHHAYEPIVAAGKNALTLHYSANNQKFGRASLVLCDIGAEWQGYAADVTRMLNIGRPTKRQYAVYTALLNAQRKIIENITSDMPVVDYHKMTEQFMHAALQEVGLMNEQWDDAVYRKYLPHAISHGLGLDVHDRLGKTRTLKPGMVITVEPGIYIAEESIGMRIEDDILITESGVKNLSRTISTALD